jgi:hypothetical protein
VIALRKRPLAILWYKSNNWLDIIIKDYFFFVCCGQPALQAGPASQLPACLWNWLAGQAGKKKKQPLHLAYLGILLKDWIYKMRNNHTSGALRLKAAGREKKNTSLPHDLFFYNMFNIYL